MLYERNCQVCDQNVTAMIWETFNFVSKFLFWNLWWRHTFYFLCLCLYQAHQKLAFLGVSYLRSTIYPLMRNKIKRVQVFLKVFYFSFSNTLFFGKIAFWASCSEITPLTLQMENAGSKLTHQWPMTKLIYPLPSQKNSRFCLFFVSTIVDLQYETNKQNNENFWRAW